MRIDVAQFPGANAFFDRLQGAIPRGGEGFLCDDPQSVRLAAAKPDHLLLHQRLKAVLRQNAIEVLQRGTQNALPGAALQVEHRESLARDFSRHFFQRCRVETFFVAKIVVEQGLVYTSGGRNGAGPRPRQAMFAEFANSGAEDAVAGVVGAGVPGSRH